MTTHKRGRKRKPIDQHQFTAAQGEIVAAHAILRAWHAVASHYGISKAAAHRIANDKTYRPSQETIDKVLVRERPLPPTFEIPACPDCHKAPHAGRCNGKLVVEVVTLAPGEIVRPAPKQRKREAYWRPCLPLDLRQRCQDAGIDVRQLIEEALK